MKSNFCIFILLLLGFSCTEKSTTDQKQFNPSWESTIQTFQPDKATKLDFKSDPFSVKSTADIMSTLLLSSPSLNNLARSKGIGGVFEKEYLEIKNGMAGIRLWYCYNSIDRMYPEFFLALEQIKTFDGQNPEDNPGDTLMVPYTFLYTEKDEGPNATYNFIVNHKTTSVKNTKIDKVRVLQFSRAFKSLMSIISPNPFDQYCKYPVAFFENTDAYKDFMNNDSKFVRYYLGLSFDPDHKPNYFRPVLVGVEDSGLTRVSSTNRNKDDEPFIQKSVPPPPHQ